MNNAEKRSLKPFNDENRYRPNSLQQIRLSLCLHISASRAET